MSRRAMTPGRSPFVTIGAITVVVVGVLVAGGPVPSARADSRTLSAFGVATIDGEVGAGEWDAASRLPFEMELPTRDGGGSVPATVYVMNDATNLYVAVKAPGAYQAFAPGLEFDNDDDGVWPEEGDDALVFSVSADGGAASFHDDVWTACPPGVVSSTLCSAEEGNPDHPHPGTRDGAAAGFSSDALWLSFIEMSHPLDSADDAHDFSLHAGDVVGFVLGMRVISTESTAGCGYGTCLVDTRVPEAGFAHIRIATPPVGPLPSPTATVAPISPSDTAWSAFGTATLDGRSSPGEWDHATRLDLVASMPSGAGSGEVPIRVFVMNDAHDLFVAVQVGQPWARAGVGLEFDNDGDGVRYEQGDDAIVVNASGSRAEFIDDFRTACVADGRPANCGLLDTDPTLPKPGTTDGAANAGMDAGIYLVELRHPLDSVDDAHDLSVAPGDVVGIDVQVSVTTQAEPCEPWSQCTTDATGRTRIRIAAPTTAGLGTLPAATVVVTPTIGAGGWRRTATVTLTGSAGTREIDWWASPGVDGAAVRRGATLGLTKVHGPSATFTIRDEGWTIVRWFAVDRAGRHGPWRSIEVRIDRSPPEVSPPVVTFVGDAVLGTASAATQVQWGGVDALSAGLRYALQESRDGGPWRTVKPAGASTTSGGGMIVPRHLVVGSTYQYRVRATDAAGNAGTWRSGPVYRVTLIDSTDRRISLTGTWRTVRDRDALGGSTLVASAAGATASLSVKGSAVALVAPTAIGRGSAVVRVDGASVGPAKFHRPPADGRIVWRTAWSAAATRLIEVSSASSARIDIDAFLVLVEQAPVQAVLQAERCPTETSGGSPQPTTQASSEAVGLALRGEGQLLWLPSGPGALQIAVPVSVEGRYVLTLFLSHGPNYGTIEVGVPGAAPPVFDLYAPSLSGPFAVGITDLPMAGPGGSPVEIIVRAKNTASTGYAVGIDRIVVTPAP